MTDERLSELLRASLSRFSERRTGRFAYIHPRAAANDGAITEEQTA